MHIYWYEFESGLFYSYILILFDYVYIYKCVFVDMNTLFFKKCFTDFKILSE